MKRPPLLPVAEVALLAFTLSAVVGFDRIFDTRSGWVGPVVFAAVAAHLLVAGLRRAGLGILVSLPITAVAAVVLTTWVHYRETTSWLLPTLRTTDAFDADLSAAWKLLDGSDAPVATEVGFVVLVALAVWTVAFLADWAAFRLWSSAEAMVPVSVLFVFVVLFGADSGRFATTAVFLAGLVVFATTHRVVKQSRTITWLGDTSSQGGLALLRAGAALGLLAVVAAVGIGPSLPGADRSAVVDWRNLDGGSDSRVVISPMVDIKGRLVNQRDVEVFTVRSSEPSWWRLTSLDTFDGRIWGSNTKYSEVSGQLPRLVPSGTSQVTSQQEFTLRALGTVWIPGAFEPVSIASPDLRDIRYEAESSTLIISNDRATADGITYTVESSIPRFDLTALQAASAGAGPELEGYLALPDDFSPLAAQTAREVVASAGAASAFEQARALQDWFRNNFTYDLDVGQGHSNNAIDEFLLRGTGYCEQFAGTFAAMARSLGLPSRVAVGFTTGDQDPDDPTLYRVSGLYAHAWPEVFFEGLGWVAFEPTPGRGLPGAENYTGVAAAQEGTAGTDLPSPEQPTPIPAGPGDNFDPLLPDLPPELVPEDLAAAGGTAAESTGDEETTFTGTVVRVLVAAAILAGLWLAALSAARFWRRRRRHAAAADARSRAGAIWTDAVTALGRAGVVRDPAETPTEFALRAREAADLAGSELSDLGRAVTVATYSPAGIDEATLGRMREWATTVDRQVRARASRSDRLRWMADPRSLRT